MKEQKQDQAHMIHRMKAEIMKAKAPRMEFTNKGAPSHGVTEGPDGRNAEMPKKVDACGYGYKGYDELAWKY